MSKPKQRSKAELLANMRVYECMKKDESRGTNIRGNTAYWRMAIQWADTCWKIFNMSAPEIGRLVAYVNQEVTELTEERRGQIREKIAAKGCDWTLRNMANSYTRTKSNNYVDLAIRQLEYHNTGVAVDYSLLAFEYVMKEKNFGKKRMDKAIEAVYYLDSLPASIVWDMRQELYDKKGIWIQLDQEEPDEILGKDFDDFAVEVFQS